MDTTLIDLEYLGPDGATHPELGLLRTGQHYHVAAAVATAWVALAPTHWRLAGATPPSAKAPAPKE